MGAKSEGYKHHPANWAMSAKPGTRKLRDGSRIPGRSIGEWEIALDGHVTTAHGGIYMPNTCKACCELARKLAAARREKRSA